MKISHFGLGLEGDDFDEESPNLVSDFSFQANYVTDYIQKCLKKEKFESDGFKFLMLRGRRTPSEILIFKEHFQSLSIEIHFDEDRYRRLYPYENTYPLKDLLKPVEKIDEFNDFMIDLLMQGLDKGRRLKAPLPYDFLINTVLDFKSQACKNEWVHKTKTFKDLGIKATLLCKLTVNFFSLELLVEGPKKSVFKKELLRTLPDPICFKHYFKDIVITDGILIVTKDLYENPSFFELPLSTISL